jgi:hypothetical protein
MTRAEINQLIAIAPPLAQFDGKPSVPIESILADAIRELTEWRPMETAPRDGTRVLVLTDRGGGQQFVAWWGDRVHWVDGWSHDGDILLDCELLGWLPLVPGPEVRT